MFDLALFPGPTPHSAYGKSYKQIAYLFQFNVWQLSSLAGRHMPWVACNPLLFFEAITTHVLIGNIHPLSACFKCFLFRLLPVFSHSTPRHVLGANTPRHVLGASTPRHVLGAFNHILLLLLRSFKWENISVSSWFTSFGCLHVGEPQDEATWQPTCD